MRIDNKDNLKLIGDALRVRSNTGHGIFLDVSKVYVYALQNNMTGKVHFGYSNTLIQPSLFTMSAYRYNDDDEISKDIRQYGEDNFTFFVLQSLISIEKAKDIISIYNQLYENNY